MVKCKVCGSDFSTEDERRKYCSDKCAKEGFRKNRVKEVTNYIKRIREKARLYDLEHGGKQ